MPRVLRALDRLTVNESGSRHRPFLPVVPSSFSAVQTRGLTRSSGGLGGGTLATHQMNQMCLCGRHQSQGPDRRPSPRGGGEGLFIGCWLAGWLARRPGVLRLGATRLPSSRGPANEGDGPWGVA